MNNENQIVLRIGIASRDQMRARTMAIAKGELKPGPNDPKVWFTSIESLAQVLSTSNQLLLELIRRAKPESVAKLAELSGREESNLSRTLHTMEKYHLVRLSKGERGRIVPEVPYDRVAFDLPIAVQAAELARSKVTPFRAAN
jgi:predicted transcriptional regulator